MQAIVRKVCRSAATIIVLAALVLVVAPANAQAGRLRCKATGTFFPPELFGPNPSANVLTSAVGGCDKTGRANLTGILTVVDVTPDVDGCVDIVSAGPSVAFGKRGTSLSYTITGQQCFRDAAGLVPTTAGFCGLPTDAFTSVVVGVVTVTGGTGKYALVSGGTGTLQGDVNHCDPAFPFGNSLTLRLDGTVTP